MLDAPVEAESQAETSPAAEADTPDPSQGEATVKVENGRRRGKRRVMKKKKVKDEDGYLGKLVDRAQQTTRTNVMQSRKKRLYGSRSLRTSPSPRSLNLRLLSHQTAQRESLQGIRAKEASPASSRKLERLSLHAYNPYHSILYLTYHLQRRAIIPSDGHNYQIGAPVLITCTKDFATRVSFHRACQPLSYRTKSASFYHPPADQKK